MAVKKGGGNARSIPEGKTQVNFNIENTLLDKVSFIAYTDKCNKSDIYNQAVSEYVERFEETNGKIKPRKTKPAVKKN